VFLIYTRNISLTRYIGERPTPLNGSMIIIKDANGYMNVSQFQQTRMWLMDQQLIKYYRLPGMYSVVYVQVAVHLELSLLFKK